jgi:hypothetical protein
MTKEELYREFYDWDSEEEIKGYLDKFFKDKIVTEIKNCKGCEYEYYTVGKLLVCKKMEYNDKCIRHPELTDWYEGKQ